MFVVSDLFSANPVISCSVANIKDLVQVAPQYSNHCVE